MLRLLFWLFVIGATSVLNERCRSRASRGGDRLRNATTRRRLRRLGLPPRDTLEMGNVGRSAQESVRVRLRTDAVETPVIAPTMRPWSENVVVESAGDRPGTETYALGRVEPEERVTLVFACAPDRVAGAGMGPRARRRRRVVGRGASGSRRRAHGRSHRPRRRAVRRTPHRRRQEGHRELIASPECFLDSPTWATFPSIFPSATRCELSPPRGKRDCPSCEGPTGCGKTRFIEFMAATLPRRRAAVRGECPVNLITVACHED